MVPAPVLANYSATKAALHSLCMSLHTSLKDTNAHVMEVLPPYVSISIHINFLLLTPYFEDWLSLNCMIVRLSFALFVVCVGFCSNAYNRRRHDREAVKTVDESGRIHEIRNRRSTTGRLQCYHPIDARRLEQGREGQDRDVWKSRLRQEVNNCLKGVR